MNAGHQATPPGSLLCGHWTFFTLAGEPNATARCDLPQGHEEPMHTFWWNPATGESFSWSDIFERHERRETT